MTEELLCAICGFSLDQRTRILSKFTGNSYCLDLDDCHRRAKNDLTYAEILELTKTEASEFLR